MGCYSCGSPNGEQFKLCPECIAKRKAERAHTKSEALKVARGETKPDQITEVFSSGLAQVFGLFLLLIAVFGILMLKGPMTAHGYMANFLFAAMVSCNIVGIFVWFIFLIRMLVHDFMWAIGASFLPVLVYRYVWLRWDDPLVKKYFLVHMLSFFIAAILGLSLAKNLDVPFGRVYNLYSLYRAGFDPKLDSNGGVSTQVPYRGSVDQGKAIVRGGYEGD